jgi:hypothetical protein
MADINAFITMSNTPGKFEEDSQLEEYSRRIEREEKEKKK